MKKLAYFLSAVVVAFCVAGCVSVETVKANKLNGQKLSASGTKVAHMNVQNWGIYLLNIPLLTGDTESVGSIAVMKDTVNATSVAPVLAKEAKKLGGTEVATAASQYSEFGLLFVSRSINMSGNVIK